MGEKTKGVDEGAEKVQFVKFGKCYGGELGKCYEGDKKNIVWCIECLGALRGAALDRMLAQDATIARGPARRLGDVAARAAVAISPRQRGVVVNFATWKAWGLVAPEVGCLDIFLHRRDLRPDEVGKRPELSEVQRVEDELGPEQPGGAPP